MGGLMSKNQFPVNGRTVLITGGSKGLGLSGGRQLAEKGANVVIVARGLEKLQEGVKWISEAAISPNQRFHYISADLVNPTESTRIISEVTAWNGGAPPDIVWCCAGSSYPTLFLDTPLEQFSAMMDSNYFTSVYMAHATLKAWLRPEDSNTKQEMAASSPPLPRHLIFTASFLSFYSFAGYSQYSPSKVALRSLSDSLSQEMNLYAAAHPSKPRVRLHTLFPATILTEANVEENKVKSDVTKMLEADDEGQTPDQCAKKCIAGLERGEELVSTMILTRLVMTSVLGGSTRSGFFRGFADIVLSWVMVIVMIFVRGDMDSKVRKWGKKYGSSGMKKAE